MNLYSQKRCELYWVIILLSFGAFPAGFYFWMSSPKQPEYFLNGCVISVSGVIVANVIQMLFEIRNYLKTLCDLTSIQHQSEIKYNQKIIHENIANRDTNNLQNQETINNLNINEKLKRSLPLNEKVSTIGLNKNLGERNWEEKKVNISKQVNSRKHFLTLGEKFSSLSFIERFFWITAFVAVGYFLMKGCRFKI